ncbi:MAG: putative toxin-antitoxin system toxin component, PIN family [Bacteroidota bacterium]
MKDQRPDRLILDTNVIVSAAISGRFEELIGLKALYDIEIYTCTKQFTELSTTFSKFSVRKFLVASPKKYIESFKTISSEVKITERFDRAPDPDDNYLFDLAYTVKSHFIVTNDKPILNLKQVNKIKIISMRELRIILKMGS